MDGDLLLRVIGFGGIAVTVISWLAIVVAGPRAASGLSWTGAVGLYAALMALFVSLLISALDDGSWARIGLFGFLALMFASGFLVAVWRTARALSGAGPSAGGEDAAH